MGSLILCHKKRAKQPYEITRVHIKIYTIEELCYYICNNLYLIDHTIMNRQLCEWLSAELEMEELADELREVLVQKGSQEQFVLTLLKGSVIYAPADINKIQVILERLKNQKDVEKAKYKADSLLESGEYSSAILVYQSIVNGQWDESVEKKFYGQIYACLGTAYGRLFLYAEAAAAYKEAYRICEDVYMLKAYLYSCYRSMPEAEYVKMLSGNAVFLNMDSLLKQDLRAAKRSEDIDLDRKSVELWKREYRKIDKK